jgi:hypothetical protein
MTLLEFRQGVWISLPIPPLTRENQRIYIYMNIYYHNRIRSGVVLQDLIRAFTYIYYIILVTVNVGIYIYGLGRLASIHLF